MQIWIENNHPKENLDMEMLKKIAEGTLSILSDSKNSNDKDYELSITFVDEATMQKLNLNYRGIDKPTDVLSFAMNEGDFSDLNSFLLGDVVICPDVVRKNAIDLENSFEDEMKFILIHGILHLFGYDHERSEADEDEMNKMSNIVLAALLLRE